ncbi:hypothetical protein NMG60_11019170 [Bertholletia excelsa]
MDESWRMRMGVATGPRRKSSFPHRRSMEETSAMHAVFCSDSDHLDPEDFSDVFGGPPRSVLSRQFSAGDFARPTSNPFYEEIFRLPETGPPARTGRNLPEFRIPACRERSEGFYSDIFGDDVRRSRSRSKSKSKSKSNSSSVLSSEELSPLRPAATGDDDVFFSSFASKLRPINVPCRWNSSTVMPSEPPTQQGMPAFPFNRTSLYDHQFPESEYTESFRSPQFRFSQRVSSPETISIEPNSCRTMKVSMDDLELNSPSSVVSSICQDPETKTGRFHDKVTRELEIDQEEDEVMSSYVIEINADHSEGTEEALGINEAIAWAKEKFNAQSSARTWSKHENDQPAEAKGYSNGQMNGHGLTNSSLDEQDKRQAAGNEQWEKDKEMEQLDENIRLWSAGKEANIRLLLSTLHQILWPNSGWCSIPLTNLIESSQVKKAYQKARLCLHPDKLQQRGATITQKYVAEKAFSILQESWAAYISQDVFFS